jgi:hypothetical protein
MFDARQYFGVLAAKKGRRWYGDGEIDVILHPEKETGRNDRSQKCRRRVRRKRITFRITIKVKKG